MKAATIDVYYGFERVLDDISMYFYGWRGYILRRTFVTGHWSSKIVVTGLPRWLPAWYVERSLKQLVARNGGGVVSVCKQAS